jgi:hypothetical protein
MSLSSQNNVVINEACCPSVYRMCNKVATCASFIHIKTSSIDSDVTIRFVDKHNRIYYFDAETDSLGYAVIDTDNMPKALLNEYAGTFRVSVIKNGTMIQFADSNGTKYDAIDFECSYFTPKQDNTYIDISK